MITIIAPIDKDRRRGIVTKIFLCRN